MSERRDYTLPVALHLEWANRKSALSELVQVIAIYGLQLQQQIANLIAKAQKQ